MYFVIEGSKTVVLERGGERLGTLSSGDFFGELAALLPPELKEHRTRTRTKFSDINLSPGQVWALP
jgi:CRP-like cAMP-binding protein